MHTYEEEHHPNSIQSSINYDKAQQERDGKPKKKAKKVKPKPKKKKKKKQKQRVKYANKFDPESGSVQ